MANKISDHSWRLLTLLTETSFSSFKKKTTPNKLMSNFALFYAEKPSPTGQLVTSWEPAAAAAQMSELRDCKRETAQCSDMNTHSWASKSPTDFRRKKGSRWKAALAPTLNLHVPGSLEFTEVNESTGCTKNARHIPLQQGREAAAHSLQSFLCSFVYRAELRLVQKRVPHFLLLLPLSLTRCDNVTILLSCQHHRGKYK